jgi:hypothetical protein
MTAKMKTATRPATMCIPGMMTIKKETSWSKAQAGVNHIDGDNDVSNYCFSGVYDDVPKEDISPKKQATMRATTMRVKITLETMTQSDASETARIQYLPFACDLIIVLSKQNVSKITFFLPNVTYFQALLNNYLTMPLLLPLLSNILSHLP